MMADEEWWNESEQKGYDFCWDTYASAVPKLSATVRNTSTTAGFEQFHAKGFDEHVQKGSSISPSDVHPVATPRSESVPNIYRRSSIIANETSKGKPTPEQTISGLIVGREYFFEIYKSKEEKVALLDAAIRSHDGNAILAVLLFLKRTLKTSLFHQEILKRPEAVNHFLVYLEADREFTELDNMLVMIGRSEEAAVLKYQSAVDVIHPETKIRKLENCLNTHFQHGSVSSLFIDAVQEHVDLLRRQLPIDNDDARQERENSNEFFVMYPRQKPLVDMSVISTLFYCCSYHYLLSENNLASPIAIKKQYRLTDKQFMWTALSALSRFQVWHEVENLFANKNWLGNMKVHCCIGFNNAIPLMAKYGAPDQLLMKYMKFVKDSEERLTLAKRYKFHPLILEILKSSRDRQGLLAYRSETSPKSVEFIEIEELLVSSNIKWKN